MASIGEFAGGLYLRWARADGAPGRAAALVEVSGHVGASLLGLAAMAAALGGLGPLRGTWRQAPTPVR